MPVSKPLLPYIGRFAPSPSGPLHAGSLVAAMASYLDAKLHNGKWLLRIEDIDETRSAPGAADAIRHALLTLGMRWNENEVVVQSERKALYQAACDRLIAAGDVYPCACTRKEIIDSVMRIGGVAADGAAIYPGTCRHGVPNGRIGCTLRLRVPDTADANDANIDADTETKDMNTEHIITEPIIRFNDRWFGPVIQDLARETGDFVLRRADGYWAYQLAVVVDDAEQGVTDVVRGADLIGSTARQIYLQRLLGVPTPRYLHVPVLAGENGEKLSKQNGAQALALDRPLEVLHAAAAALELKLELERAAKLTAPESRAAAIESFWQRAVLAWARRLS